MKRIAIFFLFAFAFVNFTFAQIDIYNILEEPDGSQSGAISKAQKNIDRADNMDDAALKDYQKYSKLFNSKKKRKRKKAEKKTLNAKKSLITAATYYDKGYQALYDLYTEYLQNVNFEFPEDRQQADNLISDAERLFQAGHISLEKTKGFSDKELKKSVKFKKLQSDVYKGRDSEKQAIEKLAKAIDLYNKQDQKKRELERKDDDAWTEALRTNTISAYQNYINQFPEGKHVAQAEQKISELEEAIALAEKESQANITYRVQILADKKPWTTAQIKTKKYYTNETIYETVLGGWYKYSIGTFKTYEEAKKFRDQVRRKVRGAFVVAFDQDGNPIGDILEAINREKGN